jgi:hypothetical protein
MVYANPNHMMTFVNQLPAQLIPDKSRAAEYNDL